MSGEWTAFDFQDKLSTQVTAALVTAALPAPEIRVLTYFPSPDEPLSDALILGHTVTDDKEQVTFGGESSRHDETVTVECQVRIVRPGAGETPTQDARDRAATLLAIVDDEIRTDAPTVGNQTLRAAVTSRSGSFFAWTSQEGSAVRVALIDFSIVYRARTSTS